MVTSNKLIHLLEVFSTIDLTRSARWISLLLFFQTFSSPWFLFASPEHHHLVFFLLEACNNLIQYQFDGKSTLIFIILVQWTLKRFRQCQSYLHNYSQTTNFLCLKQFEHRESADVKIEESNNEWKWGNIRGNSSSDNNVSRYSMYVRTFCVNSWNWIAFFTAIHKMTERTLAGSPEHQRRIPKDQENFSPVSQTRFVT